MSILDTADLAYLRTAQNELLPEGALISDKATVRDSSGGYVSTWVNRSSSTPARLGNVSDTEARAFADQLRGKATFALTLPALTPLDDGDRVVISGVTYQVVAVLAPASWETARRALVEEL